MIPLPTKIDECSLVSRGKIHCSDVTDEVITTLKAKDLEEAKKMTSCTTEKCVVATSTNKQKVNDSLLIDFKVKGPTSVKLLSNFNIDQVIAQWAQVHSLYHYNFNMRDYHKYSFVDGSVVEKPDTLATVSVADWGDRKCAACVINSDSYMGQGIHWMALFVDRRSEPFTVEFFNSSGQPPKPEWTSWLAKTQLQLGSQKTQVVISKLHHQKSKSECGVYSLYYIWCRLQGVPAEKFNTVYIEDEEMFKFRQFLFDDPRRQMTEWSLGGFVQQTPGIQWETIADKVNHEEKIKKYSGKL